MTAGRGTDPEGHRLQKVLAQSGIGSRRTCEGLIAAGRVEVNGEVAALGRRVDPAADRVAVDGVPVAVQPGLVYYLLNKPAGLVSTAADPDGRPAVTGLVPSEPRVYPVGRLDADSEGLLLLTNDGDLTYRLTHPSFGVEKEYLVVVDGVPEAGALRRLREGVDLEDGRTSPARVAVVPQTGCASPSTRGAIVRSGACVRRSATRSAAWCAPASDRSASPPWRPGSGGS